MPQITIYPNNTLTFNQNISFEDTSQMWGPPDGLYAATDSSLDVNNTITEQIIVNDFKDASGVSVTTLLANTNITNIRPFASAYVTGSIEFEQPSIFIKLTNASIVDSNTSLETYSVGTFSNASGASLKYSSSSGLFGYSSLTSSTVASTSFGMQLAMGIASDPGELDNWYGRIDALGFIITYTEASAVTQLGGSSISKMGAAMVKLPYRKSW